MNYDYKKNRAKSQFCCSICLFKQTMTFENFAFSQRALEATECSMIPKKNTEQSHSFVAHFSSPKTSDDF